MDVDDMLMEAGGFGRYQWLLMALFSVINVLSAFHYFGQTFISLAPDHWCADDGNSSSEALDCAGGWQFDYNSTYGFRTVVSELGWVGAQSWKPAAGQSLFFVGSVLGTLSLGLLADRVGRLPVLVLANLIGLLGDVATAFSNDLAQFSAARFVAGAATDSNFVMMYIIVMEYTPARWRTAGLNLCIGVFYCSGSALVPWLAALCGDWRAFLLVAGLPQALAPACWPLLAESARWLLDRRLVARAAAGFRRVARCNGAVVPPRVWDRFTKIWTNKPTSDKNPNFLGLFATPRLRRKMCILIFKSVVLTVSYDAISRNVSGLGLSPFAVFSASSATILPSCALILALQDRAGRKALASSSLLATGLCVAAAGVLRASLPPDGTGPLAALVLSGVGRFCVNVAYNSGAQYAAELIPTAVRGQGVAAVHVAGYAASFFSPYILYTGEYWKPAPELLLGGLSVIGAALCLLLPETTGKTLPHSLADGEAFGEGEGVWQFACCKRRQPPADNSSPHLRESAA
ncbi:organic cation transporter protein-like [Bacillus rossius redtenbacheri]|uniref:organic cation transporter protein-like n=1 Tax=Bacillus rossius redtenbacheri TaxID=93214 RepID=UPI002FDE5972